MNKRVLSYLGMGLTALIWTGGIVRIPEVTRVIGPLTLVFLRFLIGVVLLSIIEKALGIKESFTKKDYYRLVIAGILCSIVYYGLSNLAYIYLPSVDSAALSSMQLIFMLWGESVVLGKIVTPKKTALITLATIGGILLMQVISLSPESLKAYTIALGATGVWVIYCIYQYPLLKKYHVISVVKHQLIYGCIVTSPFLLIEKNQFHLLRGQELMSLLYLGVLGLALGYFLNAYAIKHIGLTNTSLLLILQPIIILITDLYLDKRSFIWTDYIGIIFIAIGMFGVMLDMNAKKNTIDESMEGGLYE